MSLLLAQAAVNDANIHFDRLYSYTIPTQLVGRVFPGSMVLVPFGRGDKARMAVVLAVGEVDESDAPKGLKTLYDAAPEDARLTPDLLELVRFLKERTFCTWFEAVKAVIPYGAQYRPAVVDGKHVMQSRLRRSTERLYTLAAILSALLSVILAMCDTGRWNVIIASVITSTIGALLVTHRDRNIDALRRKA